MTCGECQHYEPTRNPATGRVLRSERGRCTYPVHWPELPKAYVMSLYGPMHVEWPRPGGVWPRSGEGCTKWEKKQRKPK